MQRHFSKGKNFSTAIEIVEFQEQKLNELIQYLSRFSSFYRDLFRKSGFDPNQKISLDQLQNLPFTTKEDLQNNTDSFLCVPKNEIREFVTSTGTTGYPVTIALTEMDLQRLAYNEFVSFRKLGVTEEDIILLTITSDRCFMAGMAYTAGAREIGAAIIRSGPGLPEFQWDTILRMKPTVLVAVPSFILKLIDFAERNEIDFKNASIKKVLCIGEAIRDQNLKSNELAKRIAEKWPLQLFSTYASTEMATAFTECGACKGGHLNPELLIVEAVDENGKPVPNGNPGEIVVTTLGIEGMPLLRFKTGDLAILHPETCTCGEPTLRIGPILGRNKQMIKYKGTTIYPPVITEIMHQLGVDGRYFSVVTTDELGLDQLTVVVPQSWQKGEKSLIDSFRSRLRIVPHFQFATESEIERARNQSGMRKPIDFFDKRGTSGQ